MLSEIALNDFRKLIKSKVASARYKVGSTYHAAKIEELDILPSGDVVATIIIDHTVTGNITVTQVQLLNHNGEVWAQVNTSITRADVQEGIFYTFTFTVKEIEEG